VPVVQYAVCVLVLRYSLMTPLTVVVSMTSKKSESESESEPDSWIGSGLAGSGLLSVGRRGACLATVTATFDAANS
jgi:hypothetical protein